MIETANSLKKLEVLLLLFIIYPATDVTIDDKAAGGASKDTPFEDMKNQKKTNVTEETLNAINSAIVSNESSSGPLIYSKFKMLPDLINF